MGTSAIQQFSHTNVKKGTIQNFTTLYAKHLRTQHTVCMTKHDQNFIILYFYVRNLENEVLLIVSSLYPFLNETPS